MVGLFVRTQWSFRCEIPSWNLQHLRIVRVRCHAFDCLRDLLEGKVDKAIQIVCNGLDVACPDKALTDGRRARVVPSRLGGHA
jgi:hypothetical protein